MFALARTGRQAALIPLLALSLLSPSRAQAAGEVTQISSHRAPATPFTYLIDGEQYQWGTGEELILDGLYYQGHHYSDFSRPDRIAIRRVDRPGVSTGEPCGVFAEYADDQSALLASYPLTTGGNCDMVAMLAGDVINRGTLDVFSNTGPHPKNIERLDFIYRSGLLVPLVETGLDLNGHLVGEKRGNNPIQMAAITALDANGDPAAFGPLVMIEAAGCSDPAICYGITPIRHRYNFLQSESIAPQRYARHISGETENLAMAFVSLRALGLAPGQTYHGFALFGRDVDADRHDLLDVASYPADTADNDILPGDGADLYGGVAGFYHNDDAAVLGGGSAVSGVSFLDADGDGVRDPGEAGLPGVSMTLSAADGATVPGLQLVVTTDASGNYLLPGLPDGDYLLTIDTSSPGFPSGATLPPQSNPVRFTVAGGDLQLDIAVAISPDAGGPTANADSVDALSGQATTIDVLANDLDPVGNGLQITGVTQPAHGTVRIENGQLVYTPTRGYDGDDSFTYTVSDANGNVSTGTVNASVTRYLDLNNDGINDYDQCGGCTEIGLITGVDGVGAGGGGGGSPGAAFALLALAAARLRHRALVGDRS